MNARKWSLRIADLLRRERVAVVDVLLALAEFDRLAVYRQLGHASLFDFLHKELGLSRGMAHYRLVATRLVERFPEVVEPRTVVEPLTRQESRMHITVSPAFLALLKKAKAGQGHVQTGATDEQVLTAALELLVAHQEKRKASVPAKVKREVRRRDGGKCQWKLESGGVCGSEVRTEIDHVVPRGRGGPSTVSTCRIFGKAHDIEAARQVYGDAHMDLFTKRVPTAEEPVAAYAARRPAARHLRSGSFFGHGSFPGATRARGRAAPPRPARR